MSVSLPWLYSWHKIICGNYINNYVYFVFISTENYKVITAQELQGLKGAQRANCLTETMDIVICRGRLAPKDVDTTFVMYYRWKMPTTNFNTLWRPTAFCATINHSRLTKVLDSWRLNKVLEIKKFFEKLNSLFKYTAVFNKSFFLSTPLNLMLWQLRILT